MTANADAQLTRDQVQDLILAWYHSTNDHLSVDALVALLAPDVRMIYPNSPEPIVGAGAFKEWYTDILTKYFDETHAVEFWDIRIEGSRADATVLVRWEARAWELGAARSSYSAHLSRQRFTVAIANGRPLITSKTVVTFDPVRPQFLGL